jgi:aarF domain-containing kinase
MIFVDIPLTVFIRKRPSDGKAELVLLDHGLYEFLESEKRVSLCKLYKSIILRNGEEMKKFSKDLGVEGKFSIDEVGSGPERKLQKSLLSSFNEQRENELVHDLLIYMYLTK